jgi:cell division protein FtsL
LPLHEDVHLDVAELFAGTRVVDIAATVEVRDNNDAFLVMVVV